MCQYQDFKKCTKRAYVQLTNIPEPEYMTMDTLAIGKYINKLIYHSYAFGWDIC